MSMDTTRGDMVQAVLEGVSFAIRDNLEVARQIGLRIDRSKLCGGGANSPVWRKMLCNILGITLEIPQTEQGPGYGAAVLAMVGCGVYDSVLTCAEKFVRVRETITPDPELSKKYEEKYQKFKQIYPQVKSLFKEIV